MKKVRPKLPKSLICKNESKEVFNNFFHYVHLFVFLSKIHNAQIEKKKRIKEKHNSENINPHKCGKNGSGRNKSMQRFIALEYTNCVVE